MISPTARHQAASLACALLLAGLLPLGGCRGIGEELGDLADSFVPPTPGEAARMAVDPVDADLRRKGTLLLANASFGGTDAYIAMYRDYAVNDEDPLVRAVAIRALGRHGAPEDAVLIASQLEHENRQVRWEACKALQRIHDPVVVPQILAVLRREKESTDVLVAAAISLGQYPEDRVFQGLVAALDARDLTINNAAADSLELLTGQSFGLDPRLWLDWYGAQTGDRFAAAGVYLYPTYHRDDTFFDKLAFWTSRIEESPSPPIGLDGAGERRTYEDEESP